PQLVCAGNRPEPTLLPSSIARRTDGGRCAAASSTRSVCAPWQNCHFGTAPELSQPGSGHCWHPCIVRGHRPIPPAFEGPDACPHEGANAKSAGQDGSKKGC